MQVTKQLLVPIDIYSIFSIEVNGDQQVFDLPAFFKISSFMFRKRK